jgi:hypothetical protein
MGAAMLLCTGSLWAQSLGDVAREQRKDNDQPKATHVYTNADVTSPGGAASKPQKPAQGTPQAKATAPPKVLPKKELDPVHQRRVAELNQRVQLLASDMLDLQTRITALDRSSKYGDPDRAQKNQEMKQLTDSLGAKGKELAGVRDELLEENERARKSEIVNKVDVVK